MKIIQEENYEYAMRNEVEPYLAAHCRDKFVTGAKEDGQGKQLGQRNFMLNFMRRKGRKVW